MDLVELAPGVTLLRFGISEAHPEEDPDGRTSVGTGPSGSQKALRWALASPTDPTG